MNQCTSQFIDKPIEKIMRNLSDKSTWKSRHKYTQSGFTLIEIMIVIVVVGILVKIAMSAYTSSVQQSRRTDAKTALLDLATREEKFYSVNNQYTASPTALYGASASFPMSVQSGGTAYYAIQAPTVTAATASTAATFTAQANRITGTTQATDACGDFTITNTGVTGNVNSTATNCW